MDDFAQYGNPVTLANRLIMETFKELSRQADEMRRCHDAGIAFRPLPSPTAESPTVSWSVHAEPWTL